MGCCTSDTHADKAADTSPSTERPASQQRPGPDAEAIAKLAEAAATREQQERKARDSATPTSAPNNSSPALPSSTQIASEASDAPSQPYNASVTSVPHDGFAVGSASQLTQRGSGEAIEAADPARASQQSLFGGRSVITDPRDVSKDDDASTSPPPDPKQAAPAQVSISSGNAALGAATAAGAAPAVSSVAANLSTRPDDEPSPHGTRSAALAPGSVPLASSKALVPGPVAMRSQSPFVDSLEQPAHPPNPDAASETALATEPANAAADTRSMRSVFSAASGVSDAWTPILPQAQGDSEVLDVNALSLSRVGSTMRSGTVAPRNMLLGAVETSSPSSLLSSQNDAAAAVAEARAALEAEALAEAAAAVAAPPALADDPRTRVSTTTSAVRPLQPSVVLPPGDDPAEIELVDPSTPCPTPSASEGNASTTERPDVDDGNAPDQPRGK
jgi:hypothetical protein